MTTSRQFASSIVINQTTLWVIGGSSPSLETSTEYIDIVLGSSTTGPELPCALLPHAHIQLNDSVSMIIGGCWTNHASTFYFNQQSQQWTPGPQLIEGRQGHSAGLYINQTNDEKFIVVSGGLNDYGSAVDSVEILNVAENIWNKGKSAII